MNKLNYMVWGLQGIPNLSAQNLAEQEQVQNLNMTRYFENLQIHLL